MLSDNVPTALFSIASPESGGEKILIPGLRFSLFLLISFSTELLFNLFLVAGRGLSSITNSAFSAVGGGFKNAVGGILFFFGKLRVAEVLPK